MISAMAKDEEPKGKPVAIDRNAISAFPTEPAFVAPPKGVGATGALGGKGSGLRSGHC